MTGQYPTTAAWWKPASSKPRACPPPPAQSSSAVNAILPIDARDGTGQGQSGSESSNHTGEEAAEDGGGDAFPVEGGGLEQSGAHGSIEVGEVEGLGKELAIHVGEGAEFFFEVSLAFVLGGIEDAEEAGELGAEVAAIGGGAVGEVELEGVLGEDAGIVREEAEEDADEEDAEVVALITTGEEGIVEFRHEFGGFDIGGIFGVEFALAQAEDEGETVDVFVEVRDWESEGGGGSFFRFKVVEGNALEIRDDDEAGDLLFTPGVLQAAHVVHGLGVGFPQVLPGALVLAEQLPRPKDVDSAPVP